MGLTREQIREISENTPVSLDGTVAELQEYGEKCIYKALSALAPDAAKWRTIESAPKDGTHMLMLQDGYISEAWWRLDVFEKEYEWGGSSWSYAPWKQPTHWQPLPPPPAAEE